MGMLVAVQCRVVHDSQDYVVISKPPGVPVAPTVDNILECALTGAAQACQQAHGACMLQMIPPKQGSEADELPVLQVVPLQDFECG